MVGWFVVLVVPVVPGVGVVRSPILWSAVVGVVLAVVEGFHAVGGWRCCCDADVRGAGDVVGEGAVGGSPGVGAAGDADGKGVVGDALVDGGALTVPWGRGLATPGGGSRGCCWPVRWPWWCWPRLVSGQLLVLLMPMALQALYRVLSLRLLSLMPLVAVAEVAWLVVPLLMPATVSLVLMMLRAWLVALVLVRVWAVSSLCPGVGCLCSRVVAWWAVALASPVGSDREGEP